jgi:soluble lytic murein transglycosylase-like protein
VNLVRMKKLFQIVRWAAAIALFTATRLPCLAADSAVLRNGFSIRHEHRQIIGIITRLYTTADNSSFVDIPTVEIDHFEAAPVETAAAGPGKDDPVSHLLPQKNIKQISQPALDLNEVVKAASGTYHLDPDLVNSVIRAESGFNVRAVSPKGAQGLMQLMPQTASQLGVHNIFDPEANVDGGSRYLRELLERYNFDLIKALAAYNAGPRRVEQYGGVPPYYETKAYVARIVRDYNKKIAAKKAADLAAKKAATKKSIAKPRPTATAVSGARVQAKAGEAPGNSN